MYIIITTNTKLIIMAYIDTKHALPRRILVCFSDLLKIQGLFDDLCDGEQTKTFDTGEEHPLSCINVTGLEQHVIWARLNGRKVVCPLIKRESLPQGDIFKTSKVTVTFTKKGSHINVWAAYYGEYTPRFPDSLRDENEKIEAINFWGNAILIRKKDSYEVADKPEWANWMTVDGMRGNTTCRCFFNGQQNYQLLLYLQQK